MSALANFAKATGNAKGAIIAALELVEDVLHDAETAEEQYTVAEESGKLYAALGIVSSTHRWAADRVLDEDGAA